MTRYRKPRRTGAVAIFMALLIIPLLVMIAFAVDYGYLVKVRTDLQRAADLSALAAVQELVPDDDGSQDLDAVRAAVRDFVSGNVDEHFSVLNSDIEIGRYDPASIYSNLQILNSGVLDTVRVTLRYDQAVNSSISLFFARFFDRRESNVGATATAVLQKARYLNPGSSVLPFAVPLELWESSLPGEVFSVFDGGMIRNAAGEQVPGNWGSVDIGNSNNSTSDLGDQIRNGLRQSDLNALHASGRIPSNRWIDSTDSLFVNGDPGLSSGMRSSVQSIHGETRAIPIIDGVTGNGNNAEYHVVGWGVVKVVGSQWGGSKNTRITLTKSRVYDSSFSPNPDLSQSAGNIDGVFTSPVLVQ